MRAKISTLGLTKNITSHTVNISFEIPQSLAAVLKRREVTKDQKINLVKSYTDDVRDEKGKKMEQIPVQHGVALIMALELGAL